MAGMDITPEREKQVLFTTPYYDNSALFIGQKGKFTSVDQLKGRKKWACRNGTTHQKFIMDKHPEITTVPYDSYQNAKLDLQNGRIDGVFGDTAVVTEWLKANDKLAPVGDKVTDKDYFGTGLGLPFVRATLSCSRNSTLRWEKVRKTAPTNHLQKMVPEVRSDERNVSISKRRRDDRHAAPAALRFAAGHRGQHRPDSFCSFPLW